MIGSGRFDVIPLRDKIYDDYIVTLELLKKATINSYWPKKNDVSQLLDIETLAAWLGEERGKHCGNPHRFEKFK